MKKKILLSILFLCIFLLSSCDLLNLFSSNKSSSNDTTEYNSELESSTGKWYLLDKDHNKTNTYFEFDGSKDVMTFNYYEDGKNKNSGKYRIISKDNDGKNTYSVSFIFKKNGIDNEDYLYTYVDDFKDNFTQFTTIKEEKALEKNDGRNYSHIYRISELPYKLGTYLLDGKEYKEEKNNYLYKDKVQVPEGKYVLNQGVSITFVMPKPFSYALFQYDNCGEIVEGVYYMNSDKKTIYLYIDNDPYQYIRIEDRNDYDMTFSHDYPPDFYLRGNFEVLNNSIIINDLYHHEYSKTNINDYVWEYGTYTLV